LQTFSDILTKIVYYFTADYIHIILLSMCSDVLYVWKPKSVTPLEQLKSFHHLIPNVKSCYAGRLDPMASGWMIYLFGDKTKLGNEYMNNNKIYEFEIAIGVATDSYDCMGNICASQFDCDEQQIINNISCGKYMKYTQIMPVCSAYMSKHKILNITKPLWEWKILGQLDHVIIPTKEIELIDFNIINQNEISLQNYVETIRNDMLKVTQFDQNIIKNVIAQWESLLESNKNANIKMIRCSVTVPSGTYVRYLAYMIGKDTTIPTHAYDITRVSIMQQ
jgi:tRNA pseudouridine(55) synthase